MKKNKNGINEKNELIKELKESEWVKNPFIYSQIRGDFSLMQTNVMLSILSVLQDEINDFLAKQRISDGVQLSLFQDTFFQNGEKEFIFNLQDLGIRPDAYDELEEACTKLREMGVSYLKVDPKSGQEMMVLANIFTRIEIPESYLRKDSEAIRFKSQKRREGYMRVVMSRSNMEDIFSMRKGYVEHIRKIALICKRKRTPRMYIYLSRWKEVGHKLVNFLELKEFLGVLCWDAKRVNIKEDTYEKFAHFCKFVLDPIQKEMDMLSQNNQIDFSFTYEPRYKGGKKRGNPDELLFNIILSDMGRERGVKTCSYRNQADYSQILKSEYNLTDNDIMRLYNSLSEEMVAPFEKEVMSLKDKVTRYKPRSVKAYVIQSLKNYIESIRPEVEEIKPEIQQPVQVEKPCLSEEDKNAWGLFLELAKGAVGEVNFNTWFSCLELDSFQDGAVTVRVPNLFVSERIESDFLELIRDALYAAFGDECHLQYRAVS